MDDYDEQPAHLQMRPYSGEFGAAFQNTRPVSGRAPFRPTPPSERRAVERVLFSSGTAADTAESMLEGAWREQHLSQDASPVKKGRQAPEKYQGMALKKFGPSFRNMTHSAALAEQAISSSASAPQRKKEHREGRSTELMDLAFSGTRKIVDGQVKSNYAPVSLPYFRVGGAEEVNGKESQRPTIQHVDETNANAAKQLFFTEDGSLLEDQMFLMQLPSVLPEMLHESEEAPQEEGDEAATNAATLTRLPDGHVGKLRIHKSGKVRLELGGISFCVDEGCETFFQQDVACVCPVANEMFHLGRVQKRMVLTPDLDALLADIPEAVPSTSSASPASAAVTAPSADSQARRVGAESSEATPQAMPSAGLPSSLGPAREALAHSSGIAGSHPSRRASSGSRLSRGGKAMGS